MQTEYEFNSILSIEYIKNMERYNRSRIHHLLRTHRTCVVTMRVPVDLCLSRHILHAQLDESKRSMEPIKHYQTTGDRSADRSVCCRFNHCHQSQ